MPSTRAQVATNGDVLVAGLPNAPPAPQAAPPPAPPQEPPQEPPIPDIVKTLVGTKRSVEGVERLLCGRRIKPYADGVEFEVASVRAGMSDVSGESVKEMNFHLTVCKNQIINGVNTTTWTDDERKRDLSGNLVMKAKVVPFVL